MGYTAKYAAPEMLDGSTVPDVQTDIYAIGKILQQLPCAKRYAKVTRRCMDDDPMMRYSSVSEIEQQMKGRRMPLWAWLLAFLVLAVSLSAFFLYQQKSSEVVSGLSRPQAASQSDVRIGEEGNMVSKTDGKQQAIVEEPIPTPEPPHQPINQRRIQRRNRKASSSTFPLFVKSSIHFVCPCTKKSWRLTVPTPRLSRSTRKSKLSRHSSEE